MRSKLTSSNTRKSIYVNLYKSMKLLQQVEQSILQKKKKKKLAWSFIFVHSLLKPCFSNYIITGFQLITRNICFNVDLYLLFFGMLWTCFLHNYLMHGDDVSVLCHFMFDFLFPSSNFKMLEFLCFLLSQLIGQCLFCIFLPTRH